MAAHPIDGSPPGSPVPGILQARTLEWVAISFSNAWKWKVNVKLLSRAQLFATPWTAPYQDPPSMGFSRQEYWSGLPLPSPLSRWATGKPNRREWHDIFKLMKRENLQPRILYPTRILFRFDREIKSWYRKAKAKRTQQRLTSFTTNGFWRTAAQDQPTWTCRLPSVLGQFYFVT